MVENISVDAHGRWNRHGCTPIQLYLQKQVVGQILLVGHILLKPTVDRQQPDWNLVQKVNFGGQITKVLYCHILVVLF